MKQVILIGYKPYVKKDTNLISGYQCCFAKQQLDNEKDEFGTIVENVYIPASALEDNCDLELSAKYLVFKAYDTGRRCNVFAGIMKV